MKRVLIAFASFHGPGMAHNRYVRVMRHLPRHGYEPVLITEQRRADAPDDGLPDDRFIEVSFPDLQRAYARLRALRGRGKATATTGAKKPESRSIGFTTFINRWLLVPDKFGPWIGPAARAATHQGRSFDVVLGTCLPATNIAAAAAIAEALDAPCALEYRDLWTGNPYHNLTQPTALHRWMHASRERASLRRAGAVSCLSTGIAERLRAMYGAELPGDPEIHYNFFDPEEFAAPAPEPWPAFTLSYVGTMYLSRNPALFFQAMRRFIDKHRLTPAQFRFRWLGFIVGIEGLQRMIDENGVAPYIDFLGQIPHREALVELRRCHGSVIIQAPDDTIHIPGKMFEAMGAGIPLLAVANPCEVTSIIDRTRGGVHRPYDVDAVADGIESLWRHAQTKSPWPFAHDEVASFSVDRAVARLAALLDRAIEHRRFGLPTR